LIFGQLEVTQQPHQSFVQTVNMDHLREDLIYLYFHLGLSNKEILACLAHGHGIVISIRTLKRITSRLQLYRRKNHSDILEVALFILKQCEGQEQFFGYRWLHAKCIEQGLTVSQDTVRFLQSFIDPEGVSLRKRKRLRRRKYVNYGPNAVWHIDGNDKLKPFGIGIHGCIDGFSRNIIWIHAYRTNNNPQIIAGYFIEAVKNRNGCPQRIRADAGTENRHIEQIQIFLRSSHNDQYAGETSFLYGSSTHNQRIEWWWGLLRRQGLQYWMNLFHQLKCDGYFSGDFLDKALIQFCFSDMIQVNSVLILLTAHTIA